MTKNKHKTQDTRQREKERKRERERDRDRNRDKQTKPHTNRGKQSSWQRLKRAGSHKNGQDKQYGAAGSHSRGWCSTAERGAGACGGRMNCGSEDPGTAKRVRHRVLVSKKGVAAGRRQLEPGKCVVRCAYEAGVRELCSCAEGMRARVSSTLF